MSGHSGGWECPTCGMLVMPGKRHDCPQVLSQEKYTRVNHLQANVNCPLCDWQRLCQVTRHGVIALLCRNPRCRRQKLYRLDRWDPAPALPAPSRLINRHNRPFTEGDTLGT